MMPDELIYQEKNGIYSLIGWLSKQIVDEIERASHQKIGICSVQRKEVGL